MRIGNKVVNGRQGVWLADVIWDDGRKATLPTAHRRFFNSATKRYEHNNTGMLKYPGKLKAWKEAIVKHGAVVMTDDDWIGVLRNGPGIPTCSPLPTWNWKATVPTTASRLLVGCRAMTLPSVA